jgi:hypothetical protein
MGFHNLVQLVLKYSYMVPEHSERDTLTSSYGKLSHQVVKQLDTATIIRPYKLFGSKQSA